MTKLDRVIREEECRQITGLSRTCRWDLERRGEFPRRIRLTGTACGWRMSELQGWLQARQYSEGVDAA